MVTQSHCPSPSSGHLHVEVNCASYQLSQTCKCSSSPKPLPFCPSCQWVSITTRLGAQGWILYVVLGSFHPSSVIAPLFLDLEASSLMLASGLSTSLSPPCCCHFYHLLVWLLQPPGCLPDLSFFHSICSLHSSQAGGCKLPIWPRDQLLATLLLLLLLLLLLSRFSRVWLCGTP